jgi:hypothetical protein
MSGKVQNLLIFSGNSGFVCDYLSLRHTSALSVFNFFPMDLADTSQLCEGVQATGGNNQRGIGGLSKSVSLMGIQKSVHQCYQDSLETFILLSPGTSHHVLDKVAEPQFSSFCCRRLRRL